MDINFINFININRLTSYDVSPFSYESYLFKHKINYLLSYLKNIPFPPFELEIQMSSVCNLSCKWCLGNLLQKDKKYIRLPNNITEYNIDNIINNIIFFKINDLSIDTVKISGFIGEPLTNKKATLKALRLLSQAGLRVGLFTNGVLMDEETWETIASSHPERHHFK